MNSSQLTQKQLELYKTAKEIKARGRKIKNETRGLYKFEQDGDFVRAIEIADKALRQKVEIKLSSLFLEFNDFSSDIKNLIAEGKLEWGGIEHENLPKNRTLEWQLEYDISHVIVYADMAQLELDKKLSEVEGTPHFNKHWKELREMWFDREVHIKELADRSKKYFVDGDISIAVSQASIAYINHIKKITKDKERDGNDLMANAFSPKNGIIKINSGETISERDEQSGIMFLSQGIVAMARNPTSHETAIDWGMDSFEGLTFLRLINYLWYRVDKTLEDSKQV